MSTQFVVFSRSAKTLSPSISDLVIVGTDDRRLLYYSACEPERGQEVGRAVLPAPLSSLAAVAGQAWAGLQDGTLVTFRRGETQVSQDNFHTINRTLYFISL